MATSPVDTTFVVNASGVAAGGVWPHFKFLVDGVAVGQATVNSTTAGRYSFTTKVAPDAAHKVQIQYDNDWLSTDTSSMYRDLLVKSIEVNGKTIASTSSGVAYTPDGQAALAGREVLSWSGNLDFTLTKDLFAGTAGTTPTPTTPTAPTTGGTPIVVNAYGTAAGGVNAHFKVLVDGKQIGEGTAGTAAKDFAFTANVGADAAHKVQIQYDNDGVVSGTDRNLYVNKITIGGHAVAPTDGIVSIDKGALDGKDIVAGQKAMWWNGTMEVHADKSWFGGSTSTPTTPTPTPTQPSLSVSDVTVTEPTGTHSTGGIQGFLHTQGNQIVDEAGNTVRLTGVNWFGGEGYNYVPAGLWADSYQHHLESMKSIGFNTIRMTMSDAMFDATAVTNGIDFSKNPDLAGLTRLQVYDKVIDYAGKLGMKVILDHHRNDGGAGTNEGGLWYTSAHPESTMINNWKMLAKHYAGNETVIGADLHNEPSVSATWGGNASTDWASAAERIGNAIQTVNKDWLLFVEGTEWSSTLAGAQSRPIHFDTPDKLVYSPHAYGQSVGQFSWLSDPNYPNNLPAQYDKMWGYLYKNDTAPIMLGEWGGQFTSSAEQTWAKTMAKYLNGDWNLDGKSDIAAGDKGMSWTFWAWTPESGDVGGILMDDYKTINQTKVNIIKTAMEGAVFDTDSGSTTANTANATFTVKLSAASSSAVTVDYSTVDGTAKAGSDYTATSGKLTFAAGETSKTVSVKVLSDSVTEGNETFGLKISNPTAATIADATGTGTITDAAAKAAAASLSSADLLAHTMTASNDTATTANLSTVASHDASIPDLTYASMDLSSHDLHLTDTLAHAA
ncbi:carbohydrate-binding domain-containing protein [Azospirillum sp. TSO35-2]|uniref:cellulase family glycosylhydrolase n=1 Tax=Azospirillum sp. TSO35-2 TaxID=716796 RepID=UPI000D60B280|nr:carbohydrate-binding domain-containing protein [Azospirillum sp. TSO35-2]PWC33928.1 endoglucanase [Azospirillum sp. TSO35-2]